MPFCIFRPSISSSPTAEYTPCFSQFCNTDELRAAKFFNGSPFLNCRLLCEIFDPVPRSIFVSREELQVRRRFSFVYYLCCAIIFSCTFCAKFSCTFCELVSFCYMLCFFFRSLPLSGGDVCSARSSSLLYLCFNALAGSN